MIYCYEIEKIPEKWQEVIQICISKNEFRAADMTDIEIIFQWGFTKVFSQSICGVVLKKCL